MPLFLPLREYSKLRRSDPRVGVGSGAGYLPEFDWVVLPAGRFHLGETGEAAEVPAFRISRYLVTVAQFQAFSLDERPYPWGGPEKGEDEKVHLSQHCNWDGTDLGHTSAVGQFPDGKADCGALDLSGNVWEWCEDWYDEGRQQYRVLRGGSWILGIPSYLSCSYRGGDDPGRRNQIYGFRCVVVGLGAACR